MPITVITEDMIRYSGVSTLQELLCLYVPGMSNVEGIETNVAMHGIYGLFQDKILFLQDGHRLNGYSTNAEAPDYRNSLDKIQQIEVLRGPASSLYGNVALTAVVNIITKKGAAIKGGLVSGIVGSQSSYGGSFVTGGGNNIIDVMGWGSIYPTQGFSHVAVGSTGSDNTLYTHAYSDKPSYDIGIKARWNDITLTLQSQRSKKAPFVNFMQVSSQAIVDIDETTNTVVSNYNAFDHIKNFNSDDYSSVRGNGPGLTRTSHHFTFDYAHSFRKFELQASAFVSIENSTYYHVLGDSVDTSTARAFHIYLQEMTSLIPFNLSDELYTRGLFQFMEWDNKTYGGQAQVLTDYRMLGKGTLVAGAQFDYLTLSSSVLTIGNNYNYNSEGTMTNDHIFNDGDEYTISAFAQIKHYFRPTLILNAGLRYDHKEHYDGQQSNTYSPRISIIYKFHKDFSCRLSYNHSMVDAPYVYRVNKLTLLSGGANLRPELMKSLQFGLTYNKLANHLSAELCSSINTLDDLIEWQIVNAQKAATNIFQNVGTIKQVAIDATVRYSLPNLFLNTNATWQRIMSQTGLTIYGDNRFGIPQLMGTFVAAWAPFASHHKNSQHSGKGIFSDGKLWFNFNATIQSKTYYQICDIMYAIYNKEGSSIVTEIPTSFIMNLGATYEWKHLALNISVKNLTNTDFVVGSALTDGVPHAKRQILGKVTFKF